MGFIFTVCIGSFIFACSVFHHLPVEINHTIFSIDSFKVIKV